MGTRDVDLFTQAGIVVPIIDGGVGATQKVAGTTNIQFIASASATTCSMVGSELRLQPALIPLVDGTPGAA